MKVEIDFPADFEGDELIPIHVGRLYLGPYVARIIFCRDGMTRLVVDQAAIQAGFVHVGCVADPEHPFGFMRIEKKDGG